MSLLRIRGVVVVVASAKALAACSGGGDSPGPERPGSYDLQAAMAAVVKNGLSAQVAFSGSALAGLTGTGTFTLSPAVAGTFNGTAALLQTESISGTLNAPLQPLPFGNSVTNAYNSAATALLGEQQLNEFDVAQSPIRYPATVVTTAAPLGTISRYADSSLSVVLGTTDVTVEVRLIPVDPGSPEVVELTFKSYDTNHSLVQTYTVDYLLTADSVLSFHSATSVSPAHGTFSITLQ